MSFQYYHGIHHWSQGKDGDDADIPLKGEAKLFTGIVGKSIWYVNQIPAFYWALLAYRIYFASSKRATTMRCTSSGPSASRKHRCHV
mgnify:CR=1 FL=1